MYVDILGWEAEGLRCPDMVIDLGKRESDVRVDLIQMPNGTGKTTVIKLISAALTGDALSGRSCLRFRGRDETSEPTAAGKFILRLAVAAGKAGPFTNLTFIMSFDFLSERVTFYTDRHTGAGREQGWHPPDVIRSFLNKKCIDVFSFQGDRSETLISEGNEAIESIKAFFGLSEIEGLITQVNDAYERRRRSAGNQGTGQTEATLARRTRILQDWCNRLSVLKGARDRVNRDLEKVRARRAEIESEVSRIMSSGNAKEVELQKLKDSKEKLAQELTGVAKSAVEALRNPVRMSQVLFNGITTLRDHMQSMQLPGTSEQFFVDLSMHTHCVCGRPMTDEAKGTILENSSKYLSDNHADTVNGIKTNIKQALDGAAGAMPVKEVFDLLRETYNAQIVAQQKYNRLEKEIQDSKTGDEKIKLQEFGALTAEEKELERKLEELNRPGTADSSFNPESVESIVQIENLIKDLERSLAEAQGTVRLFNAKEKLVRILSEAMTGSSEAIAKGLKEASNSKLTTLLPEGTELQIRKIGPNIVLERGPLVQEAGSTAQNLAVAYSFTTSVLERSGAEFPLIVDHPVTALMFRVRSDVAKTVMNICHQFIGFVIDSEKRGFLEPIEQGAVDNLVQLNCVTIFQRMQAYEHFETSLPEGRYVKTWNSVVCKDNDFFKYFDSNVEGEVNNV